MANMTFEIIPLREVETGPVDYGFGWVNVGNNNTLWAHNPITQAVSLNVSSYERPHVSSEGWLFDFTLTLLDVSDSILACRLSDKAEYPLAYTYAISTTGITDWKDGTQLVKSLGINSSSSSLIGTEATGQILLDSKLICEMLQKATFSNDTLTLPDITFNITTEWITSTEDVITLSCECSLKNFKFYGSNFVPPSGTGYEPDTISLNVIGTEVASYYGKIPNGLSNTIFNPDTTSFNYELVKGYNYELSEFVSVFKVTSPFKLESTISVGDGIFVFLDPITENAKHYGTITKIISNTEFELTIQNGFNDVVVTDNTLSLMSNKYLIYDTDNISKQYSFRILPKSSATIEQSKTSLKAVEFIESDENQIAFQRGGRVWCKEFIENDNSENVEFHKNAKISKDYYIQAKEFKE